MNALVLDETKNYCVQCGNCEAVIPELLKHFEINNNRLLIGDWFLREGAEKIDRVVQTCHLELLRFERGV